jgi:phage FluMu protein Com
MLIQCPKCKNSMQTKTMKSDDKEIDWKHEDGYLVVKCIKCKELITVTFSFDLIDVEIEDFD